MTTTLEAADLFCGAGGSSTGLTRACRDLGLKVKLTAINHWDTAIATHSKNHPDAEHLCESLDGVNPKRVIPSGKLDLLLASPECTFFSNARGALPMNDQSRASPWHVVRWAEALQIRSILVENVRELERWGPLNSKGRPIKSREGETFHAWLQALTSLGYKVDFKLLNAADFGDPTARKRLFIQAQKGRTPIAWPEQTHWADPDTAQGDLFGGSKQRWRAARDIIEWDKPGKSIFRRKKPLAPTTLARIEAGMRKLGGPNAEPFLVLLRNHCDAKSINGPIPTVTASGQHVGLCTPFIINMNHAGDPARGVENPLATVTATSSDFALCEPFIMNFGGPTGSGRQPRSLDSPLGTVMTENHTGIVQPFIVQASHGESGGCRAKSLDDPLGTVTGSNDFALVEPFIMPVNHGASDHRAYPLANPMPTITSVDAWGVVEPYFVKYNRTGEAKQLDMPLDTVTTRDRFGLVIPDGYGLDIRFRMLTPRELARAMSFGDDYVFEGKREMVVKQIGNAVPCELSRALCREVIRWKARHVLPAAA